MGGRRTPPDGPSPAATVRRADPLATARGPFQFAGWEDPAMLDREVARRTVRSGSLLVAVAAAIFGAIYWLGGSPILAIPTLATSAAMIVIALIPFRDARHQLAAAVAAGLALLASQELLLGDVNTGVSVWFLVPNLAAMLLGAKWIAGAGAVATTLVVWLVIAAGRFGWPITGNAVMPGSDLVMGVSIVGTIVVVGVIARISLGARRQLMAEVEARNEELALALDEAEAARGIAITAAEAKERFFANLTHEIRTPLNGISSTAELLAGTHLDDEQRSLADALGSSTANLVVLVNAMLDHARLRAGRVSAEPAAVEVQRAAENLERLFRAQAGDKGLAFSVTVDDDVPAWLVVDAIKVRQILGNLVGNAIKFTHRGFVRVTVRLEPGAASDIDSLLVLTVSDTGVGIPPDKAESMFDAFVQGDESISRTYGGTGLGLAIARQLAGVLGGTLTHEDRPGGGSVFTLAVPCRPTGAPAKVTASSGELAVPRPGVRVLLAEDNEVNRTVGARMLARLEATVVTAEDGARAVELATSSPFDLVLMDLQMPRLDGIEAARIIRNFERSRSAAPVPIVALTGNDPGDYGDACAAAGMNGFLMKPVGLAALRELLAGIRVDPPG